MLTALANDVLESLVPSSAATNRRVCLVSLAARLKLTASMFPAFDYISGREKASFPKILKAAGRICLGRKPNRINARLLGHVAVPWDGLSC